ncbi:hypothetical protein [Prochlorococcus sp. MIT 0916]|uniref:hypothetical protein n=1 Tax=Prochlorococcus sp. MIT 0916 TaxID=3082521 RepID=UPI0039B6CBE7
MPSIRKRIGYLPSINAQETITKIAHKEKLSQSKVVGILVEEALRARAGLEIQNSKHLIRKNFYNKRNNMDNSSFNYSELDELISDKGITYNTKTYNKGLSDNTTKPNEKYNEELFEQFKQFIMLRKRIQDK